MTIIKKVIASLLVMTTLFTSIPLTSYASYAGGTTTDNGTGTGNEQQDSTIEQVSNVHSFHVNQGFRIYIVNEKGKAVSNSVDFVKYRPWEIKQGFLQSTEVVPGMSSSDAMRTGWENYYTTTGMYVNAPKTQITYLGGVKTDNAYIENKYGQINKDGTAPFTKYGVQFITREKQENSVGTNVSNMYSNPGKMYTISLLEAYLKESVGKEYPDSEFISKLTGEKGTTEYTDILEINNKEPLPIYKKIVSPIETNEAGALVGTGEEMKNLMMMPLSNETEDEILIRYLTSLSLPDVNGIGEITNEGKVVPLFSFTDSKVRKYYDEVYKKATTDAERKQAIITTIRDKKLKIAFEPVSWGIPVLVSFDLDPVINNKFGYTWTDKRIVYGTVTNIISYSLANFARDYKNRFPDSDMPAYSDYDNYLKWLDEKNVSISWQWNLPQKAYMIARDIPEYGMKAYNSDEIRDNDISALGGKLWQLGFGVMYFGVDIEGTVSTNTWDKKTYPKDDYKPGESPEPTDKSEGADFEKVGKDHKFNIIKFYGEKNVFGDVTYTENHVRENTVHNIRIDDEVDYKVKDWFTSPEYKAPTSNDDSYDDWKSSLPKGSEGDKSGSINIPADSSDTTLYLKLIKEEEVIESEDETGNSLILYADEISYPYSMNHLKENLDEINFTFPDKSRSGSSSHGDEDDRWSCDWERILDDSSYSIGLKNSFDYGATNFIGSQGVFAGAEGGKVSTSDSEKGASLSGFETERLIPNWLFTLYRDKVKDKVTLYTNKNSAEIINNLSLIGIDGASYIPTDRVAKENGGSFKNTFSIKYIYENLDKTLSWDSTGCGTHGDSGSYNGTENKYLNVFNSSYSNSDNVVTKYYLGKANKGETLADSSTAPFVYDGKTYKSFLSTKVQNHTIKFYPMVKMKYQTQSVGETAVYVTSTNESSILAPTRVDVGVYRDNSKPGLYLDSTQWSTHAKAQKYLNEAGISDKNSVLPGGAIYNLKTSNSIGTTASDNWVGLHTYQVCVPDSAIEKLSTSEGVISESQAKQQTADFIKQAEEVLSKYQIVQWVSKGIQKNEASFKSASPVLVSGIGQASKFGDNTLDRSGKYYLKTDGAGADRADLDIIDKTQNQILWTLSSDTDGNITVKNDKEISVTINKVQGIEGLISNADIKALDDKTKVVTNFVLSLDRNKDSNRNGEKWYNEAFEEIKVLENYSAFKVGFGGGQESRGSALDTKLTGKLTDRRDIYNFEEGSLTEKARTSQFKTSSRSTDAGASGKAPGYIGTIDGVDVAIPNIESLMISKLFYIPNANVTDLN